MARQFDRCHLRPSTLSAQEANSALTTRLRDEDAELQILHFPIQDVIYVMCVRTLQLNVTEGIVLFAFDT